MRRSQRLIAATVVIALSGVLAGCCGGMGSFDPSDMLDFLDTKKKLPGERKPVFPEGVPGLEQGVPKELYKGARSSRSTSRTPQAAAAAAPPPEEPKSKLAAKSKGKQAGRQPRPGGCGRADPDAAPEEEGGTAAAPPAPSRRRSCASAPPRRRPISRQQSAPAQSTQQSAAPFPAPMPSGTFTR